MADSRITVMDALIEKYTADIPRQASPSTLNPSGRHVLLTGSTGSLGSYILSALLKNESVSRVYCLNRSHGAKERQMRSFADKGLDPKAAASPKVEYLVASLGKENLGLEGSSFAIMQQKVDTIIHNAWAVDFSLPLEAFEDSHIRGTGNLIDFSHKATHHAHIFFISSIGTVSRWGHRYEGSIPEQLVHDSHLPLEYGYGESKYVCDRILEAASSRLGLSCSSIRTCQLGGPTTSEGIWNPQEIVPAVIATSITRGQIPTLEGELGNINWVPSNLAAQIVVELVVTRHQEVQNADQSPFAVFNLTSPTTTSWMDMVAAVQEFYDVETVPLSEWVAGLEKLDASAREIEEQWPALQFLPLLRIISSDAIKPFGVETGRIQAASATLKGLSPPWQEWFRNWLQQWKFSEELMLY